MLNQKIFKDCYCKLKTENYLRETPHKTAQKRNGSGLLVSVSLFGHYDKLVKKAYCLKGLIFLFLNPLPLLFLGVNAMSNVAIYRFLSLLKRFPFLVTQKRCKRCTSLIKMLIHTNIFLASYKLLQNRVQKGIFKVLFQLFALSCKQ